MRPKRFVSLWYVCCKTCTYLAPIRTVSPNGPKRDSTLPMSPMSSIGCIQNDCRAYGTFDANRAPILRQDWHSLQMGRNELPSEPRHLGVPLGASKIIYEQMVRLVQTGHLSRTYTNTVPKQKEARFCVTYVT